MDYVATLEPDIVIPVIDGQLSWAINSSSPEWPDYELWQGVTGNTLQPAQPSEFHIFTNGVWAVDDVAAVCNTLQTRHREACKAHILAHYSAEIQLSMNAGMYDAAITATYQDFLAACIAEENRVFDLLEVAADPTTVETPIWPEV